MLDNQVEVLRLLLAEPHSHPNSKKQLYSTKYCNHELWNHLKNILAFDSEAL